MSCKLVLCWLTLLSCCTIALGAGPQRAITVDPQGYLRVLDATDDLIVPGDCVVSGTLVNASASSSNAAIWVELFNQRGTNTAQYLLLTSLFSSNSLAWTELLNQRGTNTDQYLLFSRQALSNALFFARDGSTPGDGSALTNVAWSLAGFWQVPSHDAPTNVVALGLITGDCMGTNIQASLQAGTCVLHVASTVPDQHWYSGARTTNYATLTVTPTLTDFPTFGDGVFSNRSTALMIVTNAVDAFGLSLTVQGKTLVTP